MQPLTPREEELLRQLFASPPPGSKIEAALRYGVDLSLTLESLRLTPDERVKRMESAMRLMEELRKAMLEQANSKHP